MSTSCEQLADDLAAVVDGDPLAIARHADHLAGCDACRDLRHDASVLATLVASAGNDHVSPSNLVERVLAAAGTGQPAGTGSPPPAAIDTARPAPAPTTRPMRRARNVWVAIGASGLVAASVAGLIATRPRTASSPSATVAGEHPGSIGSVTSIARAAADRVDGVMVRTVQTGPTGAGTWTPLHKGDVLAAGSELRTDERTRAWVTLTDGTAITLDHASDVAFAANEARQIEVTHGRIVADVVHVDGRPAAITTPGGRIDVVGTRLSVTATATMTGVQVTRGAVKLHATRGGDADVVAGEEGTIEGGAISVAPAPALAIDAAWAELVPPASPADDLPGLGALRAYKPGETRDRDWKLALATHDVKVRIVGPIARTEITETFRNDSATTLEGVYQFPLPSDAQIDGLSLDVSGGFVDGAFVDKERAAKIWRGVIDKATPQIAAHPASEIIWVPGRWKDPALLDWKRGGRFELRIYPIPAKGQRTIKLAYTQVVTPRGPWREYVYPLPHATDGSTVADQLSVDVEVRGAVPGIVRAGGYDLVPDPARSDVSALTLHQTAFVPRGDLAITYRAVDGDAEVRAWTYAGGAAAAPDDKLAAKEHVGVDPKVVSAQRTEAADTRPTAVLALHPQLPRWTESRPRDYVIVIDSSQSMVGERYARASELARSTIAELDRRDRFTVLACDSGECARFGDLRAPSPQAVGELVTWLAAQQPAGASDLVAAMRAGADTFEAADRERWVLYLGDGFATTGFRRAADIERAIADTTAARNVRITTIAIGADADSNTLAAAARGGGGSYVAWVPGQRAGTAAAIVLESTYGSALRNPSIVLPPGLVDVAPSTLPTIRAGSEVLLAARVDPSHPIAGDIILKGTVGGQPFEQHYPLQLAVSAAAGNGFVPRLWASLAIEQLEHAGRGEERARIVALSQGYGVMSRATSLLVLESQAMFDAFGVDRNKPTATWTGEDQLDEVTASGTVAMTANTTANRTADKKSAASDGPAPKASVAPGAAYHARGGAGTLGPSNGGGGNVGRVQLDVTQPTTAQLTDESSSPGPNMVAMRRTWQRVAAVTPYDGVNPAITKAIADSDEALTKQPDSRERHRALVQALAYGGELDRARDVARRWLERDQLDPQALGYQADLMGRDGQRTIALRTLAGLVDLEPDRVELHERMALAYERAGHLAQACAHRIALASLGGKPDHVAPSAVALRCLRGLGHDRDAELVLHALPDDAARVAAEKAATVPAIPERIAGDLVVNAHWDGSADLDLSLVTPSGTRVSWMGGRSDLAVTDATSSEREQLAIRTLKRGNYLLEISRTGGSPSAGAIHGTIDVAVLGVKRALPFELVGSHVVVGRIGVSLEEHLEQVGGSGMVPVQIQVGVNSGRPDIDRVLRSRMGVFRACYQRALNRDPSLQGVLRLKLELEADGTVGTVLATGVSGEVGQCVVRTLRTLRFPPQSSSMTIATRLSFTPH